MTHEVRVLCNCDEDPCRMEVYVSDVRIAVAELEELRRLRQSVGRVWGTDPLEVLRKTA